MQSDRRFSGYRTPDDSTSPSLIDAMADGDELAWEKIAGVWGPALYKYFRRRHLQNSDAEEVVQSVLLNCGGLSGVTGMPCGRKTTWTPSATTSRTI